MKIALIGYGNMGQEIEKLLVGSNHSIVSISYKKQTDTLDTKGIAKADVAIDFTAPSILVKNVSTIANLGVNMVVGTTGWYDKLSEIEKIVKQKKIGLIYGGNFSIGGNIFFQIVADAAKRFANVDGYDVAGFEMHHTGKKDSPSGTAKKISDIIVKNFPKKKRVETGRMDRQIEKDELHFASLRVGRNFGYHEVMFDSLADTVTLSHTAHGRQGFAQGAIMAAEFIKGKKGLFTFEELFSKRKV